MVYQSGSVGGICWRICARVLRFQMATAIPPKAAEVASNKPLRQKPLPQKPLYWGAGELTFRASSIGIGFRRGTGVWKEKNGLRNLFSESTSMFLTGELDPKKYSNLYSKS